MDLVERDHGDPDAKMLWSKLRDRIPSFFQGVSVDPSLLHGDLWNGNAYEVDDEPGTRLFPLVCEL